MWAPGQPVPAPGTPDYADYQNYILGQSNAGAAANQAGNVAATVNPTNPINVTTPYADPRFTGDETVGGYTSGAIANAGYIPGTPADPNYVAGQLGASAGAAKSAAAAGDRAAQTNPTNPVNIAGAVGGAVSSAAQPVNAPTPAPAPIPPPPPAVNTGSVTQQTDPNSPYNPFGSSVSPQTSTMLPGLSSEGLDLPNMSSATPGYDPTLGGSRDFQPTMADPNGQNYDTPVSGGLVVRNGSDGGPSDEETLLASHTRRFSDYQIGGDTSYVPAQAQIAQNIGVQGAGALNTIGANAAATGAGTAGALTDLAYSTGGVNAGQLQRTNANADQLADIAAGPQGPSAAQAQLQTGANTAMAQNLALARSGRGFGSSAQGTAEAIRNNSAVMQNTANSAAALRAQEDQAFRQQQIQALGTAGQLNTGGGNMSTGTAGVMANAIGAGGQQALAGQQLQSQNQTQATNDLLNAQQIGIGLNEQQQLADSARENMVSQDYGIHAGVAIAGQQQQAQTTGSLIGAAGSTLGTLAMLSDEHSKNKIAKLENTIATLTADRDLDQLNPYTQGGAPPATVYDPYRIDEGSRPLDASPYPGPGVRGRAAPGQALGMTAGQSAYDGARMAGPAAAPDFSKSPNFAYTYKDPNAPGAAPGVQVGPMAQDLARAGSQAVVRTSQGEMVDPGRLSLETAGVVGEHQKSIAELQEEIDRLKRGGAGRTNSTERPVSYYQIGAY